MAKQEISKTKDYENYFQMALKSKNVSQWKLENTFTKL